MNELGITLLWSAVRVTLVAVVAIALYPVASRRGTGAGMTGLSLTIILALSLLAFCPLPSWWIWRASLSQSRATPPADFTSSHHKVPTDTVATPAFLAETEPVDERATFALSAGLLQRFWHSLEQTAGPSSTHSGQWSGTVAVLFLAGSGIGLSRLLLGLWGAWGWRRRSQPIMDPSLLGTWTSLQAAMRCPRRVEMREAAELTSPATVGWRRPLVLLPPDWRSWSDSERRAVLAHELAHVCRADFAAGLVARLSTALHFYHPLVHWLASRLHLQQELAADAWGAQFAGGRGAYLAALASLALRQDNRPLGWPARAFLPARGTLLRRIRMLRGKEVVVGGLAHRAAHIVSGVLLIGIGLAVSALAIPARALTLPLMEDKENQAPTEEQPGRAETPKGFDLSYVPANGIGIWAFRPATFYRRPECQKHADTLNKVLPSFMGVWPCTKDIEDLGLTIQEIEELIGSVHISVDPKAPQGGKRSLYVACSKVRMARAFDWKAKLAKLAPAMEEVSHAGKTYWKTAKPIFPFVGNHLSFFTPDDRTIVFDTEENLRRLIERGPDARPDYLWLEKWTQVDRGLLAVAINPRHPVIAEMAQPEDTDEQKEIHQLIGNISCSVMGVDLRDHLSYQAFAAFETDQAAERWTQKIKAHVLLGRLSMKFTRPNAKQSSSQDSPDLEAFAFQFEKDALDNAKIEREGGEFRFSTQIKVNLEPILEAFHFQLQKNLEAPKDK